MNRSRTSTEWRLKEHQTKVIPDLSRERALQISEVFGKYVGVQFDLESGQYQLKAGHHVGVLVLGSVRIVIEPKFETRNLFEMLTYAYELPKFRDEKVPLDESADLFPFIIQVFLKQVREVARQGIYRNYVNREENQPVLRGRLLLNQHLHQNAVRVDRFHQRWNEYTADVLENQILKFTLWQLSRLSTVNASLRRQLRRELSAFADVTLRPLRGADCLDILYTRLNNRYRTPINLAHLLLEHLSLEAEVGGVTAASFIFNMNDVFERFVAYYLRDWLPDIAENLQIEIQPKIWLDVERKEKGFPDILLRKDGRRHIILDTKYKLFDEKPRVAEADLYQMMAYCDTLRLEEAILIYPATNDTRYRRSFRRYDVSTLNLNLGGDLQTFRRNCGAFAQRLAAIAAGELPESTAMNA